MANGVQGVEDLGIQALLGRPLGDLIFSLMAFHKGPYILILFKGF